MIKINIMLVKRSKKKFLRARPRAMVSIPLRCVREGREGTEGKEGGGGRKENMFVPPKRV